MKYVSLDNSPKTEARFKSKADTVCVNFACNSICVNMSFDAKCLRSPHADFIRRCTHMFMGIFKNFDSEGSLLFVLDPFFYFDTRSATDLVKFSKPRDINRVPDNLNCLY